MKTFYNDKGKVAGWFSYGTYRKEVDSRKHRMRIYGNAYGIDEKIVHELDFMETQKIRLKERDTGKIYEVSFDDFLKNAFVKEWDGRQYFLPLKFWRQENNGTLKLF